MQAPRSMSTLTSKREKLFLNMPEHLGDWVEKECKRLSLSRASFVRMLIKAHKGDVQGREKDAPRRTLPARLRAKEVTRAPKQVLLDPEDMAYLDSLGLAGGFTRNAVVILLLLDWFDVSHLKPTRPQR